VYSFALVLNEEVGMLGWLEWWWLGVFIAPTNIQLLLSMGKIVVHRTLHCSLSGECHVNRPLGFGADDR
jgi:fatty acid desaturase